LRHFSPLLHRSLFFIARLRDLRPTLGLAPSVFCSPCPTRRKNLLLFLVFYCPSQLETALPGTVCLFPTTPPQPPTPPPPPPRFFSTRPSRPHLSPLTFFFRLRLFSPCPCIVFFLPRQSVSILRARASLQPSLLLLLLWI